MEYKVYCIYDSNNNYVIYVGSTYRRLKDRFIEHLKPTSNSSTHEYISNTNKYRIKITVLEICDCYDDMLDREYFWTKYYFEFFNLCNKDFGKIHGKSFFDKMCGTNNPNYGKAMSEETKIKISIANTGKKRSAESINNQIKRQIGKKHNYEWSKNIKESLIKKYKTCRLTANFKRVILENTGEVFDGIILASEKYGIPSTHITACCKGKRLSAGKLDGNKMKWSYIND